MVNIIKAGSHMLVVTAAVVIYGLPEVCLTIIIFLSVRLKV